LATIIGVPDRSLLYVMTRTPTPEPAVRERLLAVCKRLGYDMSKVVSVQHDYTCMPLPKGKGERSRRGHTVTPGAKGGAYPEMGEGDKEAKPTRMDVPRSVAGRPFEGPPRLCVALMSPSHNAHRAKMVLDAITEASRGKYATWYAIFPRSSTSPYYAWVEALKQELPADQREQYSSRFGWSAPFAWIEHPDGTRTALGGRDQLCEWALAEFAESTEVRKVASVGPKLTDLFATINKPGSAMAPVYVPSVEPTPPTIVG